MTPIYQDFVAYRKVEEAELQEILHQAVEMQIEVFASFRPHRAALKTPFGKVNRDVGALILPLLPKNAQELRLFPSTLVNQYLLSEVGLFGMYAGQTITHDRLYVRVES